MKPQVNLSIKKTKKSSFNKTNEKIAVQKIKRTNKGIVISFTKVR